VNQELSKLPDGFALSFPPPAIPGVGTSGGFTFVLEDRAGKDVQFLADNLQKFIAAASKRPEIAPGMVSTFLPSVPQEYLVVDREKALKAGRRAARRLSHHSGLHGRIVRELLQ
jgi:HAE1 family hydrophobic/amphiphilic exporter-1